MKIAGMSVATMRVAGLGFRAAAPESALRAALDAALAADGRAGGAASGAANDAARGAHRLDALATAAAKAQAPALRALAAALGLPVLAIPPQALAAQATPTRSPRVAALHGAGSVAEAAALAGAGAGARLIGPRAVSPDGMATAAIAERGATR